METHASQDLKKKTKTTVIHNWLLLPQFYDSYFLWNVKKHRSVERCFDKQKQSFYY